MDRYVLGIFILFMLSSCSVYQYTELSSSLDGKIDDPFTFENDTLALTYSFDKYGQAQIEILNKSKKGLYVDWGRSAVIIGGKSYPHWQDESTIVATSRTYEPRFNTPYVHTTGTIVNNKAVIFVPPQTHTTSRPFYIPKANLPPPTVNKLIERQRYDAESSPVKFRSYIMMSFYQDLSEPIVLDHNFWISELHQSKTPLYPQGKKNIFFSEELTEGGDAATTIAAVIAAVGGTVLIATLSQSDQD